MAQKIVFVHGIGDHQAGYSDKWRQSLQPHLSLQPHDYLEALWEPAMDTAGAMAGAIVRASTAGAAHPDPAAAALMDAIAQAIEGRGQALDVEAGRPRPQVAGTPAGAVRPAGILDWVRNPWDYLGDFVRYLLDDNVRRAVKAAVQQPLLQASQGGNSVAIVSHSWGTVVSYEVAHDLASDPARRGTLTLFTLGSPLWIGPVRSRLAVPTGAKPGSVRVWVNVEARGDPVGNWLHPTYAVDRDYQVPSISGEDPHGSYFAATNDAVLKDVVAHFIAP